MSHNIRISVVIVLIILTILAMLFWQQRNTARQQLALTELTHATTVAEVQATVTAQTRVQETVQAESKIALATAVNKIDLQESRQAEADAHIQEVEEQYQSALAQKLGAQAQLRLDDTVDPTLGTLLATESLQRFQSIEGDIAIRRGIELMSWRQVFTASNQGECVRSISLSADGQRLGTLSSSCRYETERVEVKVWDVNTNQEIVRLVPDHDELPVREVSLSADGHWLVIHQWGNYHMIKVVDLDTGQLVTQTVSSDWAFSSDSQQLALISNDNTVSIWDISTRRLLTSLAHDQKVIGVDYSPDGRWIVTYGEDKSWLWDASNNELTHEIAIKDARVHFSQDGHSLAIIDRSDSIVRLWEVDTWQEIAQVGHSLSIYKVEFSPDGRWLATLSSKGNVQIWETSSGTEVNRISLGSNSTSTMTFSPDGQWLATSSAAGKIQLWETATWRESARIPQGGFLLDFSADSNLLTSNGDTYSPTRVWKLEPGPEIARFFGADKDSILAFSTDGKWLATRQIDKESENIQTWDITTSKALDQSELNETQLASFTFNSDNQLKIAQVDDETISIFDSITDQEISRMVCEKETAADILSFNQRLTLFPGQTIAISVDKKLLAIGGILDESYKNVVQIWDISTCQEANQLLHNHHIAQVVISPNNQLLAVGTNQIWWDWTGVGETRIWDIATGRELVFFNSGQVYSLFFSSDSRWLVVNGTRILNIQSGREVARLSTMPTSQATFSSDNRWLATGSLISLHNEYISVWAWQPVDLIAQACDRLSRNLTKQEWHQYVGDEPYRATCPNLPMQK